MHFNNVESKINLRLTKGGGVVTTPPMVFREYFFSFQIIFFALAYLLGVQLHVFCCKIFSHTPTGKKVTPLLSSTLRGGGYHPPPKIFQIKFLPLGVKRYNLVHLVQDT